jgi:LuxR family maltose regulon positive regulatory protein
MNCDTSTAINEAMDAIEYLPESDNISRARATMALGLAYSFSDKTDKAIQQYNSAKQMAMAGENRFLTASISEAQALSLTYQGRLHQAADCYRQIINEGYGEEVLRYPSSGVGHIGLAEICLEQNELQTANDYLDRGLALCQSSGVGYNLMIARCIQARLLLALGDLEGSVNKLNEVEELIDRERPSHLAFHIGWYQVRLRLLLHDTEKAVYWAETIPDIIRDKMPDKKLPAAFYEIQRISKAKVCLKQKKYSEVLKIFPEVYSTASEAGRIMRIVEISLLKALAEQAKGNTRDSLAMLGDSLNLARPGEYVRLFLDEGEPAIELLKTYSKSEENPSVLRAYSKKIIQACFDPGLKRNTTLTPRMIDSGMVDPLTDREVEVLSMIADGLSNQDIAGRLFLAIGTIKKHINNIYAKLAVNKRTKAVARAKELGIIE